MAFMIENTNVRQIRREDLPELLLSYRRFPCGSVRYEWGDLQTIVIPSPWARPRLEPGQHAVLAGVAPPVAELDEGDLRARIAELTDQGLSQAKITAALGVSRPKVQRVLKALAAESEAAAA
ncbi:hypothetical protein GCM10027090_02530 [Sinomonas soli]